MVIIRGDDQWRCGVNSGAEKLGASPPIGSTLPPQLKTALPKIPLPPRESERRQIHVERPNVLSLSQTPHVKALDAFRAGGLARHVEFVYVGGQISAKSPRLRQPRGKGRAEDSQ